MNWQLQPIRIPRHFLKLSLRFLVSTLPAMPVIKMKSKIGAPRVVIQAFVELSLSSAIQNEVSSHTCFTQVTHHAFVHVHHEPSNPMTHIACQRWEQIPFIAAVFP
mmetsp:Transcript_56401/g.98556  ORF Transcript_56401/g.98556 Transcript_56401/m.98556 type:complete len:106 (+) Transcript_56401:200-517(+)